MKLPDLLKRTKFGVYHLRIQSNNQDKTISLKTKDLDKARLISLHYLIQVKMTKYTDFDLSNIRKLTIKTAPDGTVEIKTDSDSDAERKAALEAFTIHTNGLANKPQHAQIADEIIQQVLSTKRLNDAVNEYYKSLAESETNPKTITMTRTALNKLVAWLPKDFNCSDLTNDIIEDNWLDRRIKESSRATAKRDLTFIRKFVAWCSDRRRKYCPAPITLTVPNVKYESYQSFTSDELKRLTDNLTTTKAAWQFWLVLLGLYTGARISEIASLKVDDIGIKNNINFIHIKGTKTEQSNRLIAIPQSLLDIGFLDYVEHRKSLNKSSLFDIPATQKNGSGGKASTWFTRYRNSCNVKGQGKVFHSFRHTLIEHMKELDVDFEARCQYVGHDSGGGVHSKVYAKNDISLSAMQTRVTSKIDWQKYCNWEPDLITLASFSREFNS